MANFRDYTRRLTTLKARRNMLVGAFWILLILLVSTCFFGGFVQCLTFLLK